MGYSHLDPSFNRVVSQGHQLHNLAGLVGAYTSGLMVDMFGVAAWCWPLLSLYLATLCLTDRFALVWWRWIGIAVVCCAVMTWAESQTFGSILRTGDVAGGGFFGSQLYHLSEAFLRPVGAGLLWFFLFVAGLQMATGISWASVLKHLRGQAMDMASKRKERAERRERRSVEVVEQEAIEAAPAGRRKLDDEGLENLPSVRAFHGRGMPSAPEAGIPVVVPAPAAALDELVTRRRPEPPVEPDEPDDESSVLPCEEDDFAFSASSDDEADEATDEEAAKEAEGAYDMDAIPGPVSLPEPVSIPEPEFAFDDGEDAPPEPAESAGAEDEFSFEEEAPPAAPKAAARPKAKRCKTPALPKLDLLTPVPQNTGGYDAAKLKAMAVNLVSCLGDFGVKGDVVAIKPGPVVTMFEVKPAPGTKISRIAGLADDLALAMKALAVRIDAIPGSDAVGVEIPNETRETVYLREIFEAEGFAKAKSKLTLALGKDIQGRPFATDLARMPHLLVAGATGAGKSVCLNTILLSILYKARPDEVKLLLVDPKRIELSVYSDLPHLVHPVVTEMPMAKSALEWAVAEMDRRYQAMALLGVRNIEGYNQKLPQADVAAKPALAELTPMPYMVIIIDELADLMMTAGKEAEMSIVRLAQLARAAGIHLILATQRPSVDVVTGLIKANFPSRLSFQVSSKHDSRTILDMVGSEKLLGRGDSLYKPSGGKVMRVHGAFVDEDEIGHVVDHWKAQCPQEFAVDFEQWQQEQSGEAAEGEPGAMDSDPMYREAVEFVTTQGKASISLLQRRFRIGFNRAARFIEQMELDGMLGPQEGAKPRQVIRGRE
ncbi:cell division FtsK/SpoIIIE [Desulfovibrio sp. X2]|nr:cell division FtsK/SpoIIIE [Desulfovibrio sp. X2]